MIAQFAEQFVERKEDAAIIAEMPSRYTVSKRLGAGGHGVVFKVYDSSLAKDVAIKMLLTPGNPKLLERFHREAKLACTLNHPGIVTVLDFGVTSSDKPYMVLEYIEGQTIEQLVAKNGPFPLEAALPIFLQIADGISYAHAHHILHRDLKTSNLLLLKSDGAENKVKIVDFGLAKTTDELDEKTLTRAGSVLGSPYYMSPEQAQAKDVDQRSDIYSFGCIMFKMATGKVPIAGDSAFETLAAKASQPAPKLDTTVFPELLSDIVDRCLQTDPDDRYSSIDQLIEDLTKLSDELQRQRQLETQAAAQMPTPLPFRVGKKGMLILGTLSLIAALAAATFYPPYLEKKIKKQTELPVAPVQEIKSTQMRFATADHEIEDMTGNGVADSPDQEESFKLCGVVRGDTDAVITYKLENYLKKNPEFKWSIYNQLRAEYIDTDQPRKALEICDEIFKHRIEDPVTLNFMTAWQVNKSQEETIVNLHNLMREAPDLKYLKAACLLMLGDTELRLNNPQMARVYYKKVLNSKESELAEYRKLAASKLEQRKLSSH
jgi:Serine/threonine protein kinase